MSLHILHLEDDPLLRDVVRQVVELHDPANGLRQFANSDEAITYIEANTLPIDLFIIDIRVPGGMSGLSAAKRIRELGHTGDIVITSAYRRPAKDLFALLNCEWAAKPWDPHEIMSKLRQIENR